MHDRRMPTITSRGGRRGIVSVLASCLVAAVATVGAPASRADAPAQNWVLAKSVASAPTEISGFLWVRGRGLANGPLVLGVGFSVQGGPNPFSWVHVQRLAGGRPAVGVTAGPLEHQLELDVVWGDDGEFTVSPVAIRHNAETVAVVLFAVNGEILDVEWAPSAATAELSSSVRRGTGAGALMVGSADGGTAAVAAGAGAGSTAYERHFGSGIVGAVEWLSCQACAGSWTPPDGASRTWAHARNHASPVCWCASGLGLETAFAGPAGRWQWSWAGASAPEHTAVISQGVGYYLSQPVAAAYAPIGDDWLLFAKCRHAQGCLNTDGVL